MKDPMFSKSSLEFRGRNEVAFSLSRTARYKLPSKSFR